MNIWDKYKKIKCINSGKYSKIYKGKNKENGKYVAIKKINNENKYSLELEMIKLLENENSISSIETFNSKKYFYITMELCILNLEEYMKMRNEGLSIEELKYLLLELNKIFKLMNDKQIFYNDLKLSNILIYLNKINNISFKLCNYDNLKINSSDSSTKSPEKIEEILKNNIWKLGNIIYYLLFKKYLYQNKNEILYSEKIKLINDDEKLNDLIKRMICNNVNKRISWDDYFNHPFFKDDFEFICQKHSKEIYYYCKNCKRNICKILFNRAFFS